MKRVGLLMALGFWGEGWAGHATPELQAGALKGLVAAAKAADSDGLVVMRDGNVLVEEYFGKPRGPIEAMSVTKSVVGLAVGLLIADGKISGLDQPVADFFPEWRQGQKRHITVRHLLNHTSGLQHEQTTEDIYPSPDFVQLALAAEVSTEPGTSWSYNNKAVNLLAGLVRVASGQRMDSFLQERLFQPLGITTATWSLDHAGNAHGMSGLQIDPLDLAKVGQLMLQRGVWRGKRLLSEQWVDESTRPSQPQQPSYGLLWWMAGGKPARSLVDDATLSAMRKANVDPQLVGKLEGLRGRPIRSEREFVELIEQTLGPGGLERFKREVLDRGFRPQPLEPPTGFSAQGDLGQYLVVFPKKKLVAVRMCRGPEEGREPPPGSGLDDFVHRVDALLP